ncbi:carcinoembryonic antigen-related cell adhesion molecule 1-like [Sardina pilchardus]|uniref:carcinoembryonic antigen-related cell adhesion molecule 1-like n=1 Tax=Sardina pilchardus TaxID=27697 RepID=UPI002E128DD5
MSFPLILMLLQFLSVTHSADIQIHSLMNSSIELIGEVPNVHVVSVLWTWNKDKVVDWDEGDLEPFYYPRLNKPTLNMTTWALTIPDLQPTCNGRYALQINGTKTTRSYQLIVLEPVSQPNISKDCDLKYCTLTCKGADSNHTEYSWTDNQGRNERGPVMKVEKTEGLDGVYTCNFSNPVSWKTRSISERELFSPDVTDATPATTPAPGVTVATLLGIILGSIGGVALIIAAIAIGITYYIRKKGGSSRDTRVSWRRVSTVNN